MPSSLHARSALALAAALLAACSTPDVPKPPPPPSVVQRAGHATLTVTDANAGDVVVLERTQVLEVRLPVSVTDGLEWVLVDLPPGVLSATGPTFERAPRRTDTHTDEVPGESVWRLKPGAAGSIALGFELRRPRTLQPAVRMVRYDVTVK